jgi:hypothetical protein
MAHVKSAHGDPAAYLATFRNVETKATFMTCKCCNMKVKRHFR